MRTVSHRVSTRVASCLLTVAGIWHRVSEIDSARAFVCVVCAIPLCAVLLVTVFASRREWIIITNYIEYHNLNMDLLVSPASAEEAKYALSADIIDVKKPSEGSLGANFPWVIAAIKDMTDKPVSAAIGDYAFLPGGASQGAFGAACAGADYVKVGLMFDGDEKALEFIQAVTRAVKWKFPEKTVVIATYADYGRVDSISPFDMAPIAAKAGADVAMIDTAIKDGKSLFDHLNEAELTEFTSKNRALGLRTALAGSLKFDDLPVLKRINPEIIGVRGMVCGGDRSNAIREELVQKAIAMVR